MTEIASDRVRIAGRKVRVLSAGSGPTIVLVHGLGLGAGLWRYHLPRLGARYRVIAPDMPGFGRTSGPMFGFTVQSAADWLLEFAAAYDVRDALWVGHSVSAQYVLRVAAIRPELVTGLVLAAPTGEPGRLRWAAQLGGLAVTAFRERLPLVRDVAAHYLTTPPWRTVGTWIGARRHHSLDDIGRVKCPVLVVIGGRDPVVPWSFADRLVEEAAQGELAVLPDSAHGVALSPAEPFCRALLEFAGRTFPPDSVDKRAQGGGNAVGRQ